MSDLVRIEVNSDGPRDFPSRIRVEQGTRIEFYNIMFAQSVHIRGFSTTFYTDGSSLILSQGTPRGQTLKHNAPIGAHWLEVFNPMTAQGSSIIIEVVSSINRPNASVSGPLTTSYSGLRANEFVVSKTHSLRNESYTISHLRSDDPEVRFRLVDAPNNHHEEMFTGNWVTEMFMDGINRQRFQVGYRAPAGALETKSVTLRLGDLVRTVTLSTSTEIVPSSHEVISFGHTSGSLSLLDVKGFFGGGNNLRSYYRRSVFVPDMPANWKIPTSGSISLADFRGAATALFVAYSPSSYQRQLVTSHGTRSVGVGWNIWDGDIDDWDLGYSKFIKDNAEFRYTMSVSYHSGYGTTNPRTRPVLDSYTGNPGGWSSANKSVNVTVTGHRAEEFLVICTVTMYARHKDFPSKVVSTSAELEVRCVGT